MFSADLSGTRILVTGASSGLGRGFALTLACSGAHVIAVARRQAALDALTAEIAAAGGSAEAVSLDVTDPAAIDAAFDRIGAVDVLVNNAGVAGESRAIDCAPEEWRFVMGVNLDGVWYAARAFVRQAIAAGRGASIINIASITGVRPAAGSAAYSASKAAVIHLTKCLALEWARHGVRVNAIAPGYFETDLNRDFLASDYGQAMLKRIPQRRLGAPGELDGALLLLASSASSYMTGAVIEVDGGHLAAAL